MSKNTHQVETPHGFLKHSQEFLEAADLVLRDKTEVSFPGYFLLGRSLELAFKAFLLKKGLSIKKLRSKEYGHNLGALLKASMENGLAQIVLFEPIEVGTIQLLSHDYMQKRLEYRETGQTYYLPFIDVTHRVAHRLAHGLSEFCAE
ncbi:hypothetical protein J3L11_16460 [Shewanella sp. 4t3-1-2LB]|uniref:hypothetical protein n=1 Tax=Shewanella sp. 4t3-1-2LB TaxID=2817682 RepID=UPI001A99AD45|nr:hypothetical protein [Shewanella sp. 4t3-1-2LB]MBO1273235.1 hypothetical protein [Shewanella sp. 4t3-1-2LB]